MDIRLKRGSFIGRVHSILQEVHFANPMIKMRMIKIYATSFYGSSLWNLQSGDCVRLYSAWNNAVREAFNVPRTTHRYYIEEISEAEHPMVMLSARFIKFHQTLERSGKLSIRYLSKLSSGNLRTSHGQNLKFISEQVEVKAEEINSIDVKAKMKYFAVPVEHKWKVDLVKDMLEIRWNNDENDVMIDDLEDVEGMLENLCVM